MSLVDGMTEVIKLLYIGVVMCCEVLVLVYTHVVCDA